jgi:glucose-6-phosphate dehydrogenase assembly protein OpcA
VPPDSVRCTRELEAELATFEKMGGRSTIIHRTVRCASGATVTSRATVDCNTFNARLHAQRTEHAQTAQRTAQRPHQSELQRSEPNGRLTWLAHRTVSGGAPDCPVRHATTAFQRTHFGGWGYKYPKHPTFNCIQVFHLQHITRAITFNSRHNQRDQILSQVRNHSKSNSD